MALTPYQWFTLKRLASDGGKGAFSYGDTSIYVPGQPRALGYQETRAFDLQTGQLVAITRKATPNPIIPGSGGGARINRLQGFGSYLPGYSPNGVVLIRLTKIEQP